jgi:DNA-directed RNA polymerase subunit RPC12/RpoP
MEVPGQPRQPEKPTVAYICGGLFLIVLMYHACFSFLSRDCGMETSIEVGKHVACAECGHRIMYKKRTEQGSFVFFCFFFSFLCYNCAVVQVEAR